MDSPPLDPLPLVLISDDEPMVCSALVRALRRRGIKAETDCRSDAHAHALRCRPALIILDFVQPVDGMTQLTQLRGDPRTADIPVVVVSAVDSEVRREECRRMGAVDFATKPFDDGFIERIARLVLGVNLVTGQSLAIH
ncbi:MAG TPA: response regulator [Myxococcales bacterium]|jgi:DNA-binding response OmpR family regulator|nr:response regulator [Myxococcales bacterium]